MENRELGFIHRFIPAQAEDAPTLLLLHGTGGSEEDLLELGHHVLPQAGLLSPRGAVDENGMARFFRRIREGVFDLDDIRRQSAALSRFVGSAASSYGFDPGRVVAMGYSNGANIAASLLLLHPRVLAGAVLFHAMVPIVPDSLPNLSGVPVFMASGRQDPIIPAELAEELARMLGDSGAEVTATWEDGGHRLSMTEVEAAAAWLANVRLPTGRRTI